MPLSVSASALFFPHKLIVMSILQLTDLQVHMHGKSFIRSKCVQFQPAVAMYFAL